MIEWCPLEQYEFVLNVTDAHFSFPFGVILGVECVRNVYAMDFLFIKLMVSEWKKRDSLLPRR